MQVGTNLHTRQSSTESDKYQVLHRYSYFFWWWTHSRPKHVEKRNKHTKKNCAPSWLHFQDNITVNLHLLYNELDGCNLLNNFNYFSIYFHSNLPVELALTLCCTRKWFLTVFVTKFSYLFPCPCHRQASYSPSSVTSVWMGVCWLSGAERALPSVLPPPETSIQLQLLIHSSVIWHVGMWIMKHVRSHSSTETESHTTATINFLQWTSLFPTMGVVVYVINIVCRFLQESAENILHMIFMTESVVARKIRITQLT